MLVIASAPTVGTSQMIFGDRTELVRPEALKSLGGTVRGWWCGPEPACEATARGLGGDPRTAAELAGPDVGAWTGHSLAEVAAREPEAVRAWLADPDAVPPGGESLAHLVRRIGSWLDGGAWPLGRSVAVVTPLTARALAVHALGAPASVLLRLDVAPSDRLVLTRAGPSWRLRLSNRSSGAVG